MTARGEGRRGPAPAPVPRGSIPRGDGPPRAASQPGGPCHAPRRATFCRALSQCATPQCPAPQCPAPQCPAPQCPAPQCAVSQCPALQCPAPNRAAPQCAAPQCAAPNLYGQPILAPSREALQCQPPSRLRSRRQAPGGQKAPCNGPGHPSPRHLWLRSPSLRRPLSLHPSLRHAAQPRHAPSSIGPSRPSLYHPSLRRPSLHRHAPHSGAALRHAGRCHARALPANLRHLRPRRTIPHHPTSPRRHHSRPHAIRHRPRPRPRRAVRR